MPGGTTNDVIFKKLRKIEMDMETIGDNADVLLTAIAVALGVDLNKLLA